MKKVATIDSVPSAGRKAAYDLESTPSSLSDKALLALHQRLQGNLSASTLIGNFFLWLGEHVPVASIEFVYPEAHIKLSSGEVRQHSAHYVLRLEQRYLGEVTLSAARRMSERHQYIQEQALGVLVHYVKNALDHLALEKVAYRDSLTGAMNRTALDELFPREVARAQRYEYNLSVAMIDLDHFKSINERLGHVGADEILRKVSGAIQRCLRSSDLTFRYGGDEFLVILPGTDLAGAHKAASQILASLGETAIVAGESEFVPELSIGVASRRVDEGPEQLLRRADEALFAAKNKGRNCVCQ